MQTFLIMSIMTFHQPFATKIFVLKVSFVYKKMVNDICQPNWAIQIGGPPLLPFSF